MEQQKILNLLNEANDSKFGTRTEKRNIINDNSKSNYDATNQIIYNREILKSNLCDCNNAYILLRGDITVVELRQHKQRLKIVHHLLNVSQKLMKQQ